MNPQFPLFIVSKGRSASRLTSKALERMNTPYYIVIEEQEYKDYAAVIDKKKIVILDKSYQDNYETLDDLENTKSKGPGPARNFIWEYSMDLGFSHHWVMDDNIVKFYRYHQNKRFQVGDGTIFKAMEDFCLRYENIGMAGPNYSMFIAEKLKFPPFVKNTRIYSCNFIRNDIPFRWRGRYNEDTILSIDMMKKGWCTVQFNAFLQDKIHTQVVKGGNTAEFYAKEGTMPKSQMLVDVHPDVSEIKWRFKRWHHYVDYTRFKHIPLRKKKGLELTGKPNNYGMVLKKIADK